MSWEVTWSLPHQQPACPVCDLISFFSHPPSSQKKSCTVGFDGVAHSAKRHAVGFTESEICEDFFLSQFKTQSSLTCWSSVAVWQYHKLLRYFMRIDLFASPNKNLLYTNQSAFVVWKPRLFMWISHPRRLPAFPLGVINVIFHWVTNYVSLMIQFHSCTSGVICIRDTVDGNQSPASPAPPSSNPPARLIRARQRT